MKKTVFLFLIVSLLLLTSCEKEPGRFSAYSFDFFDTATTVVGYADSKEEFDKVVEEIFASFEEYHKLFTIYNRYDGLTNLCSINMTDKEVNVDEKIIDLLTFSKDMYSLTNGRTNVAMGSVLSIWHSHRETGIRHPEKATLPSMDKLLSAAEHTSIDSIVLDKENGTVCRLDSKMTLDVGAVAKGFAVARVAEELESKGISGYLLNVGGNVCTIGTRPDGTKWAVGIENPTGDEDEPYIAYLKLADKSVVTSGSYQRYYFVNGEKYHHIIDPDTLMPGENYISVSVICDDSGVGDALSTALFCMSFDDGAALVECLEGVEAMWMLPSGEIKYSTGFLNFTEDKAL
ncbi:MAG: FAD:protein FMN transferase [Clostridia bacterium]|nr:FAD:protein FMN transferase [Clostridia bacterium]